MRGKAASVTKVLNSSENIQNIVQAKDKKERTLQEKEERKKLRGLKRSVLALKPKTVKVRRTLPNPLKKLIMYDDSDDDELDFNESECM